MTKPIDFTKPLRIVGTHERVRPISIPSWAGIKVETEDGCRSWMVRSNGQPTAQYCENLAVENVPAEPRIVTRWTEVVPGPHGSYRTAQGEAFQSRFTPSAPHRRLAKLLIEEFE